MDGAAALPHLLTFRPLLDVLQAHHFIPDGTFHSPRLTFRPARDEEHKRDAGEYVVPEGYTFHRCDITSRPFLLPEGGLCPVLVYAYDAGGVHEQHPEDAEAWVYVVHPALVIAGPEAVHAALWEHIANNCRGLAEALLSIEQAAQVVGAFDPAEAAEAWPAGRLPGRPAPSPSIMQTTIQHCSTGELVQAVAPSASLRELHGIDPGAALDLEACQCYVTSGVYLVSLGGSADLYDVARTPSGGYALRNDSFTFYIDPAGEPDRFEDRDTGLPVEFAFLGRVLRVAQTFALPVSERRGGKEVSRVPILEFTGDFNCTVEMVVRTG